MWRKLRFLLRRDRLERELDEEMSRHIEARVQENIEGGMAPDEARRTALVHFGNRTLLKEDSRALWGFYFLETLAQDLRYALRALRRDAGFTAVAAAALGLGIGLNTSAFTLVNGIAFCGLPVRDPASAVRVFAKFSGEYSREFRGAPYMISFPEYAAYRDSTRSLSGLAAFWDTSLTLTDPEPEKVSATLVSGNYFEVLGGSAFVGRVFGPDETAASGKEAVVVLSHAFWRRRFGADPGVVGRRLVLNRHPFTVIGIAASDFMGTEPMVTNLWIPLTMQRAVHPERDWLMLENVAWLEAVGRLRPGVSITEAQAEMGLVARRLDASHPGRTTSIRLTDGSLASHPEGRTKVLLVAWGFLIVVGLVLLVACANVANLLLARGAARRREIGTRLSLGAGRLRLVRQLVTESAVLGVLGGALGLFLTYSLPEALLRWVGAHDLSSDLSPDLRVLAYTFAVSLATGVLFGLAPALDATRLDLTSALKSEGSVFGGRLRPARLQGLLIGFQIAVCVVFLVAAALLLRGVRAAMRLDPGFEARELVGAALDLSGLGYGDAEAESLRRNMAERLRGAPQVKSVALAFNAPFGGGSIVAEVDVENRPRLRVKYNAVSESYFATAGIPLLRGRTFADGEGAASRRPAVVSETMARRFWPGEEALGKTFRAGPASFEVVGVARDARSVDLSETDGTYFYKPIDPRAQPGRVMLIRTAGGGAVSVISAVRAVAAELEPRMNLTVRGLKEVMDQSLGKSRILSTAAAALGFVALGLAAVGISGLVAFAVRLRTHEIGVRVALGAGRGQVLRLVFRLAMPSILGGLGVGLVLAALASRLLVGVLYGLNPLDSVAFGGVILFLGGVALGACYLPARRALSVDPLAALRHE
jgi:macrolide transport system ATP-binding/permease protein